MSLELKGKPKENRYTKENENDTKSSWCWKSVINDENQRPLEYAIEQEKYVRPTKNNKDDEQIKNGTKVYNYLCLTGEVNYFP